MTAAPFLSVVIPTHDRGDLVTACVESLLALDYPKDGYEVVVVDAASAADARARVEALAAPAGAPAVRCLRLATRDANAARNAGLDAAHGDLLALVDDDASVPPGWAAALVAGAVRHPDADCLGGPVRPLFERRAPRTCSEHELAGAAFDEGRVEREVAEVWGCNMAVRRGALERTGPLREGLRFQQEWEWQQRLLAAGGRIVYLPDAWLWHRRLRSDLHVPAMVREFFVRGYMKGAHGQRVVPRVVARRAAQSIVHAVSSRCMRGLTESARDAGMLCGALALRLRRLRPGR